jgi:hypothetical protein
MDLVELRRRLEREADVKLGTRESAKLFSLLDSTSVYDKILFVYLYTLLVNNLTEEEIKVILCER